MKETKVARRVPDAPHFTRWNNEGVGGADLVRAAKFKARGPLENECKNQLDLRLKNDAFGFIRTDRSYFGKTAGCLANRGFLRLPAIERRPRSLRCDVMEEALTGERSPRVSAIGEFEPMFRESRVNRGRSDLDNLKASRTLQHLVPDLWRLQYEIAFIHDERLALVLIDHPHPAAPDIDHLKPDSMKMHPVCDGSTFRN